MLLRQGKRSETPSTPKTDEARERARKFLDETNAFAELGLQELSADARMLARLLLELGDELDAERSARIAQQHECTRLRKFIGGPAHKALRKGKR